MFVSSVSVDRDLFSESDWERWPFTVPCVSAIARGGLELTRPVTFLVGENGSGKSTLVEAIAEAYGLDARGGRAGRKYDKPGLYLMDEPEAALSFSSCLRLLTLMHQLAETGAQIICATHSPVLASLPGADIIEVGEHGYRRASWGELDLTDHWRRYLANPDSYLRHSLGSA
jgi:predicted ATPase